MNIGSFRLLAPLILLFLAVPSVCVAQNKFDASSVKHTDRCSMQNTLDPGMMTLNGVPLRVPLSQAFRVKMDQIIGPSWLESDCFVISAKMPEGATKEQLPEMLEALLIERFRLTAHKETRTRAGYTLVVDKKGPQFRASNAASAIGRRGGQVTFSSSAALAGIKGSMTMATFARLLSNRLDLPVQDLTQLDGKYDIDVSWVPDRTMEKIGMFAQSSPEGVPSADSAVFPPVGTMSILPCATRLD